MFGVEITDSGYVVASMRIMARMGSKILARMEELDADFVPCLHSVGAPLAAGEADVAWPCNDTKYISHFPEERMIWSYGSGYGGNALLGKKCYALRIASAIAHDEGWLAEHMLILKLTPPGGSPKYIAAAFPSACGKTNLAMIEPTIPGWKVETLGDDIAWMRFVMTAASTPSTLNTASSAWHRVPASRQSERHENHRPGQLHLHQCRAHRRRRCLVGGHDRGPSSAPHRLKGRDWTPDHTDVAAHPNSRFCTPITQCPIIAPEFDDPRGVPIDAILFGGRRKTTIPLVVEARDWVHGTFMGATLSSEDNRGRDRGRRHRAPRPDGDAAVHRLPRRRLSEPLDHGR
jgi:phosphoenolpyruvate carboxykinase (GTP)